MMATVLAQVRDFLLGETKAAPAPPPLEPELKQVNVSFSTDTYTPDAFGGAYWNPLTMGSGGSPSTLNSAVYACLKELASAFKEAPLRVSRHGADGTEDWVDGHPVMELLADPHPSLSQAEVNGWLAFTLHVNGNAYLRKIRDRAGEPVQLWPVSPLVMRPETTETDRQAGVFISHYLYDDGRGRPEEVPVADILHFRLEIDDTDHRMGMSPLRRLLREIASDEAATLFQDAVLKNTGVTSLAVTVPPGPVLTQEQADQVRERLQESLTGTNRGRVAVVANGGTVQQLGFSPQQLDLKAAHYVPETRIGAVTGVPPTLINLASGLEHSIYNNVRQGQEHFYEQTINPLWRDMAATFTKQLLWVDYPADKAVRFRYDTTNVRALQEDQDALFARYSVAVEKGWVTKDEARAAVGLAPLPNGLGEAQDPLEQARQMAEITAQNRPPGGQQSGAPGGQQGGQPPQERRFRTLTTPEEKDGWLREQKQAALAYLPELQRVQQFMALPTLQQKLEAYFAAQADRVLARAKKEAA
jgi:HK97 family phage portal protein